MKKIIVIFFIIIFIIIAGVTIYFHYNSDDKKEINLIDFNIAAFDSGRQVETNYTVSIGSIKSKYKSGKTLKKGYTSQKIPENMTVFIYNNNINNQSYYTNIKELDSFDFSNKRVELQLEKASELYFDISGNFSENDDINVTVKTDGYFMDPIACIKWSQRFITSKIEGFNIIEGPSGYVRCYDLDTNFTPNNNSLSFNLSYKTFGILDSKDYVLISLYDRDIVQGIGLNNQTIKINNI